jgi:DNA polymerase-3 subunit gamma/tau
MTGLDLTYRPHRFGEVAGQKYTVAVLNALCRRRTIPSALLFHGSPGSGKTTSARIVAAALNCEATPGPASLWPCGVCASCKAVVNGTSLDVIEIDAASNGSVERIREIRELVQYGTAGQWRVVILDEAHSMSRDAFNAVLKVLEEPPERTVFVLCTTEPGKILETVVSRCSPFEFTRLPPAVVAARLREVCTLEGIPVSDDLLARLAEQSAGIMRNGLKLLDQAASVGIKDLGAWLKLTGDDDFAPAVLAAAATGDHARLFAELDRVLLAHSDYSQITAALVGCLRDVLVLGAGGTVTVQGEALAARQNLAQGTDSRRVVNAMRVLWDLQVRVRTEDKRAGLELAVTMVADKLCPAQSRAMTNGTGILPCNGGGAAPVTAAGLTAMGGFAVA